MDNKLIKEQLSQMNITYELITEVRSKDGVYVYRIRSGDVSYVLKYFEKEEYRREISNYMILKELGIQTIPLIAYTDKSILMIDIEASEKYRLATKEDMTDPKVCARLGEWYHNLHESGKAYIACKGSDMYMETSCITAENLTIIKRATNTCDNLVWSILEQNFRQLQAYIDKTEKTLTYNDFYYTNMIVAQDKSESFMFDYNLLGKGYVASDIKNVTIQLSEDANKAFLDSYGEYNQDELLLHEVVGLLVSLYFASCKEVFPQWAYEELELVKNGHLLTCVKKLFGVE